MSWVLYRDCLIVLKHVQLPCRPVPNVEGLTTRRDVSQATMKPAPTTDQQTVYHTLEGLMDFSGMQTTDGGHSGSGHPTGYPALECNEGS